MWGSLIKSENILPHDSCMRVKVPLQQVTRPRHLSSTWGPHSQIPELIWNGLPPLPSRLAYPACTLAAPQNYRVFGSLVHGGFGKSFPASCHCHPPDLRNLQGNIYPIKWLKQAVALLSRGASTLEMHAKRLRWYGTTQLQLASAREECEQTQGGHSVN